MNKTGKLILIRKKIQNYIYEIIGDVKISKFYYLIYMHRKLNLENPSTFNEKLQWLKLFYFPYNNFIVECTDKFLVRNYIKNKFDSELNLPELYGVWEDSSEIEFENLPSKFVLKCTHGCGYNIICKNKDMVDSRVVIKKLNMWLKEKYGNYLAEPHYNKISPRIICEEYLDDDLIDYKFYCFNGKVLFFHVSIGNGTGVNNRSCYFNPDGTIANFNRKGYGFYKEASPPKNLVKMIKISEKISQSFPFVRVDLYEVNGKIYFSELTFTSCACMMKFNPSNYDLYFGEKLCINNIKNLRNNV